MKVTFNKVCVCLAFIMTSVYAFCVVFTGACPPDAVTYMYNGFWIAEIIMTTRLVKAENNKGEGLLDKAAPYINEENGEAIAEKIIGVDLKKKKGTK